MRKLEILGLVIFALFSTSKTMAGQRDPHSNSRPEEVSVNSVELNLTVNFKLKVISGAVSLSLDNKTGSDTLYLDTKDLIIHGVHSNGLRLEYSLGASDPVLGQALMIKLPDPKKIKIVTVQYETKPSAAGLNWMDPAQTLSKKPFLFSLSAPIFSRTWMPCLDTPSVRAPYSAKIQTRSDLLAVMSARNPIKKSSTGRYVFKMPQPVPAYLIALAIGDLEYRNLGPRSGVYAEPTIVDAAAREFADSEKILKASENLFGPFRWERADLLILPYSFAYGGMENPRLTFLNAATVVGDRSMVNLVAHEYAHYWSGNLVLPTNWNNFWLNEGVTSYAEVRILESVYGKTLADQMLSRNLGELSNAINDLKDRPADTYLHLNLAGRDPDDGINDIAYQKGAFFLLTIEQTVGRERFDKFLKAYFERFKFQSIGSDDFVKFLNEKLIGNDMALRNKLAVEKWIYGPGIPSNAPKIYSEKVAEIEKVANAWKTGVSATDLRVGNWSVFDWVNFLDLVESDIPSSRMVELDQGFRISDQKNPEVLFRWYKLVIKNGYVKEYPHLQAFLLKIGRGKYVKPLYKAMAGGSPEVRNMGLKIFADARDSYHPVVKNACAKILGVQ